MLDLGCVDHSVNKFIKDSVLHKKIKHVAKEVVGVDIIKVPGIVKADVQNFNINKKFDTIVVGELIEHLENFKGFLNSVKLHMNSETLLIISTPNVFSIGDVFGGLIHKEKHTSPHHMCWFSEKNIKTIARKKWF